MAATTTIRIPAGTVVFEHRNGAHGVEERPLTLKEMAIVEATRMDDGRWGYCLGRTAYSVAGGCVDRLPRPSGYVHISHEEAMERAEPPSWAINMDY